MGWGLFAKQNIQRGTRVFAETPLLAIPDSSEEHSDHFGFCAALQQLPQENIHSLDGLHCNTFHITLENRQLVRRWYKDHDITNARGEVLKGKKLQDRSKATVERFAKFLTNRVMMGADGIYGSGVFPLYSHINHSCVPNVHNAYNPTIQCLTVYSTRDIQAGEQITVSYLSSLCRTRLQRQGEIQKWGFDCACAACTEPSLDSFRQRMSDLDQRLAAYANPLVRHMAAAIGSGPTSAKEALQDAEELITLFEHQGLQGMELCNTYVPFAILHPVFLYSLPSKRKAD